jgi:hypothetical protein
MSEPRRQALERCDDVVQAITAVCWALEAGDYEKARSAATAAQEQAQALMTALLGEDVEPGSLRRTARAD